MERMGRRRLQNGNFAITLFNVRCFLLTCLHGPDCNWCAIAGQASYGMCLWRRLFHWPQGCLGYMAKPVNLAVAVSLSTSCLVFFFVFWNFRKDPTKWFIQWYKSNPWTHSTGCCEVWFVPSFGHGFGVSLHCWPYLMLLKLASCLVAVSINTSGMTESILPSQLAFRNPWNWKKLNPSPLWTHRFTR